MSLIFITLSHLRLQQFGQMGILLFPLVRVASHYWEERPPLVDMGKSTYSPPSWCGDLLLIFFDSYILAVSAQPSSPSSHFSSASVS